VAVVVAVVVVVADAVEFAGAWDMASRVLACEGGVVHS
jgi:hypothetical protein